MKNTLSVCSLFCVLLLNSFTAHASTTPQWSYQGNTGPSHWGTLDAEFAHCDKSTFQQSPISLPLSSPTSAPSFSWHYQPATFEIRRTPQNVYFYYKGKANTEYVKIGNETYYLRQIHFHIPAEHKDARNTYAMEAHLVNMGPHDKIAAVAVWLRVGPGNPFLAHVFAKPLPNTSTTPYTTITLNPADLFPKQSRYYNYHGSLTVPPCTAVTWIVIKNPMTLSQQQLNDFHNEVTAFNSRPVQSRTGTPVRQGTHMTHLQ